MDIRCWKCILSDDNYGLVEFDVAEGFDSFDAITMDNPGGAYTTFRTYDHYKVLRLDEHLGRLKQTAHLAGQLIIFDQSLIYMYLRLIVEQYPQNLELRIRIVLDLFEKPGEIYIMAEILKTPLPEAYRSGVRVTTCKLHRNNPKAKLTASIPVADKIRRQLPTGVEEALMVDEASRILEGLTSNFFAVKGGELWTNEEKVLSGITRSLVLDETVRIELPVNFNSITITEIPDLEEAFITSSSRGILPVKQIDRILIGSGNPGPITVRLMNCLEDRIRDSLLEI
jgi:branched-chain amino acid aminotransferase